MGGILIKEMLAKGLAEGAPPAHARLAAATAGLAFYATPHHGSWLADVGWCAPLPLYPRTLNPKTLKPENAKW